MFKRLRHLCLCGSRTASISSEPSNIKLIESDAPIEEETLAHYEASKFYPVRIGETFKERYHVLGKLGYGSKSTVWLCHDTKDDCYVTLKVCAAYGDDRSDGESSAASEFACYKRLGGLETENKGMFFLRMLEDTFLVTSPAKHEHRCFVYEPAVMDLESMLKQLKPGHESHALLKKVSQAVLMTLDLMHTEVQVIHGDVKVDNILFLVTDNAAFGQVAADLKSSLIPAKYNKDAERYIYPSVDINAHMKDVPWGKAVLADLGEARQLSEDGVQEYCCMYPEPYRPPEIRLEMEWSSTVDIWAAGVLIWSAFERNLIFGLYQGEQEKVEARYLAQMVGLLGPPPLDFLKRSDWSLDFWDRKGAWKGNHKVETSSTKLEDKVTSFEGAAAAEFLDFIRSMLRWVPEERMTAKQLLAHPFLRQFEDSDGDRGGEPPTENGNEECMGGGQVKRHERNGEDVDGDELWEDQLATSRQSEDAN